ncbi:hypothetical protein BTVI_27492 [Pitangus sulphuratus]|nr:hypothetical protein BTVI_27492 [Pitangus sulphuratus]
MRQGLRGGAATRVPGTDSVTLVSAMQEFLLWLRAASPVNSLHKDQGLTGIPLPEAGKCCPDFQERVNVFVSVLDPGLKGALSLPAIPGTIDSFRVREVLQRDPDKLEVWAITSHMRFKKDKCWILHLGWGNPGCMYRLGNKKLESSTTERDLSVQANGKIPSGQEGQPCLGVHQAKRHRAVKVSDFPVLLCTGVASP